MLPLAAGKTPATPAELAAALTGGFAARGVTVGAMRAEGAALDALLLLRVDATGARFTRVFRLSASAVAGAPVVLVERLEISGAPLDFEGTPLRIEVQAERAALGFAGPPEDGALVLVSAETGSLLLGAAVADLEALVQQLAAGAAEKQGVEIKRTKLEFTARGPQALSFRCTVTAKMFIMSADLALSGELAVDAQLNARVSGLTLGGDAMITKIAGGFIRPQLEKLEGRVFPLGALSPGGLPLREVEIGTDGGLEIRAKFGRG